MGQTSSYYLDKSSRVKIGATSYRGRVYVRTKALPKCMRDKDFEVQLSDDQILTFSASELTDVKNNIISTFHLQKESTYSADKWDKHYQQFKELVNEFNAKLQLRKDKKAFRLHPQGQWTVPTCNYPDCQFTIGG